jgi:NADP-dependent 3-hydroxy acid dehydrogenase YdfG
MTALDAPYLQISEMKISGARGLALSGALDVTSATRLTEAVEFAVWGTQGAFVLDLTELDGIGFATADALAQALGTPPDSPGRLDAGLRHALVEAESDGHCHLPRADLAERARRLLGADADDRIDELAARIEDEGGTAVALEVDVSDEAAARGFVETAHERLGRLDTLVNNAGVMLLGPVEQADSEDWRTMVNVNLLGLMYCTHAALPIMLGQEGGDIVNISSVAGRFARAGNAVYAATKFGVGAFSEGLRNEVTERGVRVTLIEPGFVDTELQGHNTGEVLETLEAMREHLRDPLRAQDIANGILYAVSQSPHVSINEVLIRPTRQTR